ncbi:hypothetical protein PCE1_000676 [Barthelona sp. PCE]
MTSLNIGEDHSNDPNMLGFSSENQMNFFENNIEASFIESEGYDSGDSFLDNVDTSTYLMNSRQIDEDSSEDESKNKKNGSRANQDTQFGESVLQTGFKAVEQIGQTGSNFGMFSISIFNTLNQFFAGYIVQLPLFYSFLNIDLSSWSPFMKSLLGWILRIISSATDWYTNLLKRFTWTISVVSSIIMFSLTFWIPATLSALIRYGSKQYERKARRSRWEKFKTFFIYNFFYYGLMFFLTVLSHMWDFGISFDFTDGLTVQSFNFIVLIVTIYLLAPSIVSVVAFPAKKMSIGSWLYLKAFISRLSSAAKTQFKIFQNLFLPKDKFILWRILVNVPLYIICLVNLAVIMIFVELAAFLHIGTLSLPMILGIWKTSRKQKTLSTRSGLGVVGAVQFWQIPCLASIGMGFIGEILNFKWLWLFYLKFCLVFSYFFVLEVYHTALLKVSDEKKIGVYSSNVHEFEANQHNVEATVRSLLWSALPGGSIISLTARWMSSPPLRYRSASPLVGIKRYTSAWIFSLVSVSLYVIGFILVDSSLYFMIGFVVVMFVSRFLYFGSSENDNIVKLLDNEKARKHAEEKMFSSLTPEEFEETIAELEMSFYSKHFEDFASAWESICFNFGTWNSDLTMIHASIIRATKRAAEADFGDFWHRNYCQWFECLSNECPVTHSARSNTTTKVSSAYLNGWDISSTSFRDYLFEAAGIADVSVDYIYSYIAMLLMSERLHNSVVFEMSSLAKDIVLTHNSVFRKNIKVDVPAVNAEFLTNNMTIISGFVLAYQMNHLKLSSYNEDSTFLECYSYDLGVCSALRVLSGEINPYKTLKVGIKSIVKDHHREKHQGLTIDRGVGAAFIWGKNVPEINIMPSICTCEPEELMISCACLLMHWSGVVGTKKMQLSIPFVEVPSIYFTRNSCIEHLMKYRKSRSWEIATRGYLNALYLCDEILLKNYFSEYTIRAFLLHTLKLGINGMGFAAPGFVMLYLKQDLYSDAWNFNKKMSEAGLSDWIINNYIVRSISGTKLKPTVCLSTARQAGHMIDNLSCRDTDSTRRLLRIAVENSLWEQNQKCDELCEIAKAMVTGTKGMNRSISHGESMARLPILQSAEIALVYDD